MLIGRKCKKTQCCKYLGIIIDSRLKWCDHINYMYKKLIKLVSIFYKIRSKLTPGILKMIYIYPLLLYGIEIYANTIVNHLTTYKRLLELKLLNYIEHIRLSQYSYCINIKF